MSDDPGPMVRRRQLGSALRRYRLAAGLTITDVASRLSVAASTVSRIETAQRKASVSDVRYLCEIYGIDDVATRDQLMELAQSSRRRAWWEGGSISSVMQRLIGLETAAEVIKQFEPLAIPGLLQTYDYAFALTPTHLLADPGQAHDIVEARMRRQQILRQDAPPRFEVIIDEAALHRTVGGGPVMREQIQQVARLCAEPHIIVRVIPFSAGAHIGMSGGFSILEFSPNEGPPSAPDLKPTVYTESLYEDTFSESELVLKTYQAAFAILWEQAVDEQASLEIIERAQAAIRGGH